MVGFVRWDFIVTLTLWHSIQILKVVNWSIFIVHAEWVMNLVYFAKSRV